MSAEEQNPIGASAELKVDSSETTKETTFKKESGSKKRFRQKIKLPKESAIVQVVKKPRIYVNHSYRDFSRVLSSPCDQFPADISKMSFPQKIHHILSQADYSKCISWMPHGRAFRVHSPIVFEKQVALKYLGHTRYSSFLRQLSNHRFKHITKGPDRNAFYHECMLRGLPHLCKYIPPPIKNASRLNPDPENEPNFYEIMKLYPLPGDKDMMKKDIEVKEVKGNQGSCQTNTGKSMSTTKSSNDDPSVSDASAVLSSGGATKSPSAKKVQQDEVEAFRTRKDVDASIDAGQKQASGLNKAVIATKDTAPQNKTAMVKLPVALQDPQQNEANVIPSENQATIPFTSSADEETKNTTAAYSKLVQQPEAAAKSFSTMAKSKSNKGTTSIESASQNQVSTSVRANTTQKSGEGKGNLGPSATTTAIPDRFMSAVAQATTAADKDRISSLASSIIQNQMRMNRSGAHNTASPTLVSFASQQYENTSNLTAPRNMTSNPSNVQYQLVPILANVAPTTATSALQNQNPRAIASTTLPLGTTNTYPLQTLRFANAASIPHNALPTAPYASLTGALTAIYEYQVPTLLPGSKNSQYAAIPNTWVNMLSTNTPGQPISTANLASPAATSAPSVASKSNQSLYNLCLAPNSATSTAPNDALQTAKASITQTNLPAIASQNRALQTFIPNVVGGNTSCHQQLPSTTSMVPSAAGTQNNSIVSVDGNPLLAALSSVLLQQQQHQEQQLQQKQHLRW